MIKKLISVLLVAMLAFSVTVSAEMGFSLSADADKLTGTEIKLAPGEMVKVFVLDENADIENINVEEDVLYFEVLSSSGEEAINSVIDMTLFDNKKIYKVFAIPVNFPEDKEELGDVATIGLEIGYDTLANRKTYLSQIKNALKNDSDEVAAVLEGNAKYMGINLSMYALADADKVAEIMFNDQGRVDFNGTDELQKMVNFIDESMLIEILNGENANGISLDYISRFIKENENLEPVKNSYAGIKSEYKVNVLNDIINEEFEKYEELEQILKNSIVLNAFNYTDTNADGLYKILNDSKNATSPKLDLTNLNSWGYADKMTAVTSLSMKKYNTIEELNYALINDIERNTIVNAPGGSGGGGGGGSDDGSSKEAIDTVPAKGITPYTDMDGYAWADEALYALTQTGVISGYENGEFRPQNKITRAEFVKIIISCFFKESVDIDCPFEDVDENKWYAPYIETALANGIISGVSETEFCPEKYITRQDMAVVLYNTAYAIDFDLDLIDKAGISDEDTISDYAKDAVFALKNIAVINGYEDGSFRPSNNANRAETVQMIYNFLMKKGEYDNENN